MSTHQSHLPSHSRSEGMHSVSKFEFLFEKIVSRYLSEARSGRENLELKKDHSLRVFREAALLAEDLNLDPPVRKLCLIAALFHDIGRFPQYARYGTFRDELSLDHARAGYELLKDSGTLAYLVREEERIVLIAVLLHNRMTLPTRLSGRIRTVVEVVRDADKLDILPIVLGHLGREGERNPVVTLGLQPHPEKYSEIMVSRILQRRLGVYEEMVWENDFALLLLSWVYDFNFLHTCREFVDRGYLDRIFTMLPRTEEMNFLRTRIETHIRKRK